jgi:hypothetical protein
VRGAARRRDRSVPVQERGIEENNMAVIVVLAVWLILQIWVLPRLGVPT